MPRSSRLETHDHSTCGFMAWCRKSGAQVAGKLENSTAIVAADGEKSARIDLKVLPAFDKCPNEGKDEQLRSLLQHSFDELKLRYDGHVARFDCLTLCLIRCSHTHRKCFDFYNMHKVSPWTLLPLHSGRGNAKRFAAAAAANTTTKKQKRARASRPGGAKKKKGDWSREQEQATSHYSRGKLLETACDFDGACAAYREAVKRKPTYAIAQFRLAHLLERMEDFEGAIEHYSRAIDPKDAIAHFNLGVLLQNHSQDFDGAEKHYRRAIAIDPEYAATHYNLGLLLENHKEDYDGAEQHYRRAIAIDPENGHAHYSLGVLLENKADYGGAEQHYRRARAIDPEEHADAHCELAGQPRPSWCL